MCKSFGSLLFFPLLCRCLPCFQPCFSVSLTLSCCLSIRLLLSVWRAGCENVAVTPMCECVSLNACAPPPPLCSEGDRGQVPWIARSLLPLPSLFQSLHPPPSLPSLSWHQHSRDCCQNTRQGCQDTWRLLNRERECAKTSNCSVCRVHTVQAASFCGHSLLQVLVDVRNIIRKKTEVQTWNFKSE